MAITPGRALRRFRVASHEIAPFVQDAIAVDVRRKPTGNARPCQDDALYGNSISGFVYMFLDTIKRWICEVPS